MVFSPQKSVLDSVDWNAWFHSPGMPPQVPDYDVTMMQACVDLSEKWQKVIYINNKIKLLVVQSAIFYTKSNT